MPLDPQLLVAFPFVTLLAWMTVVFIRKPEQLYAITLPILLQVAWVIVLGFHIHYEGPVTLSLSGFQDESRLPQGMALRIDWLGVLLSGVTVLVMSATAVYSVGYFQLHRLRQTKVLARERFFLPLFISLWIALLLLWMAADLLTIYLALEMMGLSAAAMMALPERAEAITSGLRYLFIMLLGSLTYLLGAGICYAVYGQVGLSELAAAAQPGSGHFLSMAFMGSGLMLKAAVFPLHAWLPKTHAEAWTPVSAVHAALVVKGSFFVFATLWMTFLPDAVAAAQVIGGAGAMAIIWGGVMALGRQKIKHIVAYSTIAQLGYLLLLFPLAASTDEHAVRLAWQGTWLLFLSHALAKAAMFLSVGNIVLAMGRADLEGFSRIDCYLPHSLLVFGLATVSIIGLPVSGGFTAKWMLVQSAILTGQWHWVVVLALGTLLGAAYIFRVFSHALVAGTDTECHVQLPLGRESTGFVLAMASILMGLFAGWPLMLGNLDPGGPGWP